MEANKYLQVIIYNDGEIRVNCECFSCDFITHILTMTTQHGKTQRLKEKKIMSKQKQQRKRKIQSISIRIFIFVSFSEQKKILKIEIIIIKRRFTQITEK